MKAFTAALLSALILYLSLYFASGSIDCHYCGIRNLCTLPYDETFSEKISCPKSCMKFDGKASDGKRVLVRSCGFEDTNICNKTTDWHGSVGEKCICNASDCNTSQSMHSNRNIIVINISVAFLVMCWLIMHQKQLEFCVRTN